jgi:peroxiredoxin
MMKTSTPVARTVPIDSGVTMIPRLPMSLLYGAAAVVVNFFMPSVGHAALPVGAPAPEFNVQATLGGEVFDFSLASALKTGPVVLYFYPAAFTKGCTIEARDFAEATDEYRKYGATVLGISADKLDKLKEFSVSACRSKFAVGADPESKIIRAYQAKIAFMPNMASRISYVITPDHKIYYAYSSMDPDNHVANTMAAVRKWSEANR